MSDGKDVCDKYINGSSLIYLSKMYNTSSLTIKKVVELNGHKVRNKVEAKAHTDKSHSNIVGFNGRRYTVNETYFSTWSRDVSYILGLLASDGYITERFFRIVLKREDKELLETIASKIGFTGTVRDEVAKVNGKSFETAKLEVYNKRMVDDIKSYGISERKSKTIRMPKDIPSEYKIDYIRGFFDGDGTVGKIYGTKSNTLNFRVRFDSGCKGMIEDIVDALVEFGVSNKAKISTNSIGNIFEKCYSTIPSEKIHSLFYDDENSIYMKRKKNRFDELIHLRKIH